MSNVGNNPPPNEDREFLKNLRVLVVDDDIDSLWLTGFILEECGTKVMTAASASEAFKMFLEAKPDMLVCDLAMLLEDGYSLIRKIRGLDAKQGGQILAIALTALTRQEDCFLSIEAGFQMHLSKPIEPVELVQMVAGLARQALFNKTESN